MDFSKTKTTCTQYLLLLLLEESPAPAVTVWHDECGLWLVLVDLFLKRVSNDA